MSMRFTPPLIPGTLIRRYKRFLADVVLENGAQVVAHSPNTGSMLGVSRPGSRIWLQDHGADTRRKTRYTWELTELPDGVCVGVNTARSNVLAQEALHAGAVPELDGYAIVKSEVRYGRERSRIDLLLQEHAEHPDAYVEVKNVTAIDAQGAALFPDAVTLRGQKHLRELMRVKQAGCRAVALFVIQRADGRSFRPAWEIDPQYGRLLAEAASCGVEIYPLQFAASPEAITFSRRLPLQSISP